MTHRPIFLKNIGLSFSHKRCFSEFTAQVFYGQRIALIGRNGSGKSTLLHILQGLKQPSEGDVLLPEDVSCGYVPQVIDSFDSLSGGERLNKSLTHALALSPNILLLDEPTNHLDLKNRRSLFRLLSSYDGTLIVASHDREILRQMDTLWHIDQGAVRVFTGNYDDYISDLQRKQASLERQLSQITRRTDVMHQKLMQEQQRAATSRKKGEKSIDQRKWPTIVSQAKARRAEETSGRKKNALNREKEELRDQLGSLRLPEVIMPTFSLHGILENERSIVQITDGWVGYKVPLVENINLSVYGGERLAITGNNGSGKSTFLKALLNDQGMKRGGSWYLPKPPEIGYLDQHYRTLDPQGTVFESIHSWVPSWSHADVRRHLNDFLFRKNEEVMARVSTLSGGEKARLSLAQIAAKPPKLLILDEVTNNLDLETRDHIVQVLKEYPGTMIIVSHDEEFLKEIGVSRLYPIRDENRENRQSP